MEVSARDGTTLEFFLVAIVQNMGTPYCIALKADRILFRDGTRAIK